MADEVIKISGFEPGTFEYSVAAKAKIYLEEEPSALAVSFAIEKFRQTKNYTHNHTESFILQDMNNNIATIAMAVVDLFLKVGAENETSHSDSGTIRTYENAFVSLSLYSDIVPYVDTPF